MVAAAFLLSLATARPVVARLAGDFYPMSRELAVRPRIQRLFWHLTLMWACFVIAKASMTLWLLHSQSLQTFVVAKSISGLSFNALGIAVTIAIAMVGGPQGRAHAAAHDRTGRTDPSTRRRVTDRSR